MVHLAASSFDVEFLDCFPRLARRQFYFPQGLSEDARLARRQFVARCQALGNSLPALHLRTLCPRNLSRRFASPIRPSPPPETLLPLHCLLPSPTSGVEFL